MPNSPAKDQLKLELILKKEPRLRYTRILSTKNRQGRSAVTINETKNSIIIKIKAPDATALRASANSILRDLQVIEATDLTRRSSA